MFIYKYLQKQVELHPSIQPQDIVKLCYQAAFGAEHLLSDITSAYTYFSAEYKSTPPSDDILFEEISTSVCRVNLSAWKKSRMPAQWLFRMFLNSSSISSSEKEMFENYIKEADDFIQTHKVVFTLADWKKYIEHYKDMGMPSVHHSQLYRETEHPAYRIVHKRFIRLLPILQKCALLSEDKRAHIIAIDGRAASGKSTLADDLKLILDCGIVHVDDFFLPLELRTKERFSEPGGNVHYERFKSEVLPYLSHKDSFSYLTFDCRKMDYGQKRLVEASNWRIVEGAYSHHPYLGEYADIKVFSDIDSKYQMERIRKRNGDRMAEQFKNEWIPLEEEYYKHYHIKEKADIVIPAIY